MCMSYNSDEPKHSRNECNSNQRDIFMLITPDSIASSDAMDSTDMYMKMEDSKSYDVEGACQRDNQGFPSMRGSEAAVVANEAHIRQDLKQRNGEDDIVTKRRSHPQVYNGSRCSWSSNEGSVFSSSASETPSPVKSRPVAPPRRTRRDAGSSNTSIHATAASVRDENPIPLPPKVSRQLSHQSSISDEERTSRFSPIPRRIVDYGIISSSDSEGPTLPPYNARTKIISQSDDEKSSLVTVEQITGTSVMTSTEDACKKELEGFSPVNISERQLPPTPKKEHSPFSSRKDMAMQMHATLNKGYFAKHSQFPVQYQREISQQSARSDGDISPIVAHRPLSPQMSQPTRELRSFSEMSLSAYEEIAPIANTGRKPKTLWKEIGKRLTLTLKHNKGDRHTQKSK